MRVTVLIEKTSSSPFADLLRGEMLASTAILQPDESTSIRGLGGAALSQPWVTDKPRCEQAQNYRIWKFADKSAKG
jgi:hypothetical protein